MSVPKLFISYCWSNTEHEEWVLRLGTELRENGVDVILDKWNLKEGNDANAFMEKMVTDKKIKKVILVINDEYSEKANKRSGGVGAETQIISAEVYGSVEQNKFVPVIANRDHKGNVKLPVFCKSLIYIDLSDKNLYKKNFKQLLHWVHDKSLNVKPEIGSKPAFLEEEASISIGTDATLRRLIEAVENSSPQALVALREYFDVLSTGIDKFRLEPSKGADNFDQKIIDNIASAMPIHNELIKVFSVLAQYDRTKVTVLAIHEFFESLIPYLYLPNHHICDWDNLKFIVHESFLLCITIFLKYERFDVVEYLLTQRYFVENDPNTGNSKMHSYGVFRNPLESLIHRDKRLNLKTPSLHADLIKERCSDSGISFEQVMQADFILYLADAIDKIRNSEKQKWWPVTLVFKPEYSGAFEIFLRAESKKYCDKLFVILDIKSKVELNIFIEGIGNEKISVPKWGFDKMKPLELMNFEQLCSRA